MNFSNGLFDNFIRFFQFQENAAAWGKEKAELLAQIDDIEQSVQSLD
jgi:hypothetical protein